MKIILKGFIKFYVFIVSPFIGQNCRFHPTCSAYAYNAIETHGAIKGGILAIKRLVKCHPFYKGNANDPVPD